MKCLSNKVLVLAGCAALLTSAEVAEANPIAICYPGAETVTGQTVEVSFTVGTEAPGGPYVIHRSPQGSGLGPGDTGSVAVGDVTTESSSEDMGSGVESVTIYHATEACVPLGSWDYTIFTDNGSDFCGAVQVTVDAANPSCAGTGGSGTGGSGTGGSTTGDAADDEADDSCSVGSVGGGGSALAGSLLACLLALGLYRRRR